MTIQRNAEAFARAYAAHTVWLGSLLYAETIEVPLLLGSMSHYRMRCTERMDSWFIVIIRRCWDWCCGQ